MTAHPGRAVVDGSLRYTSVSAVEKADRCLRAWWLRYVHGIKEPESKGAALGNVVHNQMDHYLSTGEDVRGPLARALDRFTPPPKTPQILVEQWTHTLHDGKVASNLMIEGVPFVGKIDILNGTGAYIDTDGAIIAEPGVIEIADWKTTKDWQYAKSAPELVDSTIQMPLYGEWHFRMWPERQHARLSHTYVITTGTPTARKVTTLVDRERVAPRVQYTASVIRSMKDVAREPDPNKVTPNVHSCDSFGGCPHHQRAGGACRLTATDTLVQLIGGTMSQALAQSLASFMPPAAAPSTALVDPTFREAVDWIFAVGKGMPQFAGEAARQRAIMIGRADAMTVTHLAGSGDLADLLIGDIPTASALRKSMADSGMAPVVLSALPPDAPLSNPALASVPVPGWSMGGGKSPDDPPPPVTAPEVAEVAPSGISTTPAEAPKRGRGRPRKTTSSPPPPGAVEPAPAPVSGTHPFGAVDLYVDCRPRGVNCEPFSTIVASLCAAVCDSYKIGDIRQAPKGTPLEYGGWKGFLAAFARDALSNGQIPAGAYYADSRNDLGAIIIDALEPVVDGFVRGER